MRWLGRQLALAHMLHAPATRDHMVWDEAILREKNFAENFRYGIPLEPQALPLAAADLLLPPSMVAKGAQFDLPLPSGQQRLSVAWLQSTASSTIAC